MPSRSQMDRPAMVAATLIGVFLIVVSIPLYGLVGEGEGQEFSITWTESEAGSDEAATGASGATTTVTVMVDDALPSNATVRREACVDGASPLGQPATITWTLYRGDERQDSGTFGCAGPSEERVAQNDRPDVGAVQASGSAAAQRQAYARGDNETVEYRLEFSWSRAGGPLPLPVQQPFTATLSLTIEEWTATANDPDQEVPR